MTTAELFMSTWTWDPTVLLGCAALFLGYAAALRFRLPPCSLLFLLGDLLLLLSLISPIDTLGDRYLLSAHMVQHLVLLLIVPPLLLLGLPRALVERGLAWAPARRAERVLSQPLVAWLLAFATLWVWHLPLLYDATLHNDLLHAAEHLAFLVTATIFWWPLLTPLTERRLQPIPALVYLVTATVGNDLLGIIITFAPVGFYPSYLNPPNPRGILTLVREGWGVTPDMDQQVAGVLMWIFGSLPYFAVLIGIIGHWLGEPDYESTAVSISALTEEA